MTLPTTSPFSTSTEPTRPDPAFRPTTETNSQPLTGAGASAASADRPDSELLNRVVQGAHHTIDRLAESAGPAVQRLQQGVTSASDALHSGAGHVREVGDEWVDALRGTVRDNPVAAVATALVAGLLIARLTQR